jgi:uncharacterized protein YgbK (DUF1537 family)
MRKDERNNNHIELAVRCGIIIDFQLGAVSAWTFMASNGVSTAVILRVLTDKNNRRQADQLAFDIAERCRSKDTSRETAYAAFNIRSREAIS